MIELEQKDYMFIFLKDNVSLEHFAYLNVLLETTTYFSLYIECKHLDDILIDGR